MDSVKLLLQNKKIRLNLILLSLLVLFLPIGILLVKQTQVFFPKADVKFIEITEGECVSIRKGIKVLTCVNVPLKIINPFLQPSPTPTASSSASTSPTPTGSTGTPKTVNVKQFENNIQAALDSLKTSGGAVYLPAGTYTVPEKVRVFSNVTLFGDGMGQTIIKVDQNSPQTDKNGISNDSTNGKENIVIRDLTIQGPNVQRVGDVNCCSGLLLRGVKNSFVINVESVNWGLDGIYLGYRGTATEDYNGQKVKVGARNVRISGCKVSGNQRHQIIMSNGTGNVIDGCTITSSNSVGATFPSAGIDLEPDPGGDVFDKDNKILGNNVSGNLGILLLGVGGESGDASVVSGNAVCRNSVSVSNVPYADGGNNNVWVGNSGGNVDVKSGTSGHAEGPESACAIPSALNTLPEPPTKPQASSSSLLTKILDLVIGQVYAGDEPGAEPTPSATPNYHPSQAVTVAPTSTPTSSPTQRGTSPTISPISQSSSKQTSPTDDNEIPIDISPPVPNTFMYRLAESEESLAKVQWKPFVSEATPSAQFIITSLTLSDPAPGPKQIWAEFVNPSGKVIKDHITVNLSDKDPIVSGINCTYDLARQNIKISIVGQKFGQAQGSMAVGTSLTPNEIKATSSNLDILSWTPENITLLFKSNLGTQGGQNLKLAVIRDDDAKSQLQACEIGQSSISLGARVFCRDEGHFDIDNVKLSIYYNPDDSQPSQKLSKIDETVTIDKSGFIQGLKTKLQLNKNYGISIHAPNSLTRNALFKASEGTTIVSAADGGPFILPIGDIAPVSNPDGQINSLDRAEISRQWRILGENKKLTGDFNRDGRVNSIDWACMRYDFDESDDSPPTTIPSTQNSTGSEDTRITPIISQ